MTTKISADTLSRIDKLFLDQDAAGPEDSRNRRANRGLEILIGDDVGRSSGLQLAVLTAVNLGIKCFAGNCSVRGAAEVWTSPCLSRVADGATLGEAVTKLGGSIREPSETVPPGRHLLIGNGPESGDSVRVTYDGWLVAVGPSADVARLHEREHCPLASIAAAAIAVGEMFADFGGLNVSAGRRVVSFSLWRPDLPVADPISIGFPVAELPAAVAIFGLGHLGQAYVWSLAAQPYESPKDLTAYLCDDDWVESANVETGALLQTGAVDSIKTRVVAAWLEARGFSTRLIERRLDQYYRRSEKEPVIALSGFDDNLARRWLSDSGFEAIFDSGLGGEAHNFDTIAFHAWPNPRPTAELWPRESEEVVAAREKRRRENIARNAAYGALDVDNECGRVVLAGKSVAVPFVGAVASCLVLAEMLKAFNGGPTFHDLTLRLCSLGAGPIPGRLASDSAPPIRGFQLHRAAV